MKNTIIAIFSTISLLFLNINTSSAFDSDKPLSLTLKYGASKQDVMYRTPIANSILTWSSDNIDLGTDLEIRLSPEIFANIEYNYSKVKGGSSTDDDIENGYGAFSWHGVNGQTHDVKISLGYKHNYSDKTSIIPLIGIFHKEVEVESSYGSANYESDFSSFEVLAESVNKYSGVSIGAQLQRKLNNEAKFNLRIDYLIPLIYSSNNIWYGRDPDLYWNMKNSRDYNKGDFGARIKSELGFKVANNAIIDYIKLYAFYEYIQVKGLIEEGGQGSSMPNYAIDGRNCSECLSEGVTKFEAFGAGIAVEF